MQIPDCLECGACCVKEPLWVEVNRSDYRRLNNPEMLEPGDILPWAMKTKGGNGQCVALDGIVGQRVCCTVYENRPEICRQVERGSEICIYMLGWHKIGRGY